MIVVDASVVVEMLRNSPTGRVLRRRLVNDELAAPDILPVEVTSALRGLRLRGQIDSDAPSTAVTDLSRLAVTLHPTLPLLQRTLQLSANLSTYDAAYVALAETLNTTLLTGDRRLASAPGTRCAVEPLTPDSV